MEQEVQKEQKKRKVNIGFIIFLVIFIPILLILLTIIVKSKLYPEKTPDIFGYKPFIVLNNTKTEIQKDDLIFTKIIDGNEIQIGDIICYRENNITEVHEVIDIKKENGKIYFVIDLAEIIGEYKIRVDNEIVEGKYIYRIPNLRWNVRTGSKLFYNYTRSN